MAVRNIDFNAVCKDFGNVAKCQGRFRRLLNFFIMVALSRQITAIADVLAEDLSPSNTSPSAPQSPPRAPPLTKKRRGRPSLQPVVGEHEANWTVQMIEILFQQ